MAASRAARHHRRLLDLAALALVVVVVIAARQAAALTAPALSAPPCPALNDVCPFTIPATLSNPGAFPCPHTQCCTQWSPAADRNSPLESKPETCLSQLHTIQVSGCTSGLRTVTIKSNLRLPTAVPVIDFSHACFYDPDKCLKASTETGPPIPNTCEVITTNTDTAQCGLGCSAGSQYAANGCAFFQPSGATSFTYPSVPGGTCVHFVLKKGSTASTKCGTYTGRLLQVCTNWQQLEAKTAFSVVILQHWRAHAAPIRA
jgi:hypothetical protein